MNECIVKWADLQGISLKATNNKGWVAAASVWPDKAGYGGGPGMELASAGSRWRACFVLRPEFSHI